VFLEAAYFEPTQVRRTSKKTGLATESSRRFERGADPNGTLRALNRATELFVELAGATLVGEENDVYPERVQPVKLPVSVKKINRLLGTNLSKKKIISILTPLEIKFGKSEGDRLVLAIPTFRPDLTREIDIVEEVGRLYGYDNIPQAAKAYVNQEQTANERVVFADSLRTILSGMGLKETVSLSLVTPQTAQMFLSKHASMVELLNPLSQELSIFRPHMLISALTATAYNRNRQIPNLRFFEIGNVAWKAGEEYIQKKQVVAILAGQRQDAAWYGAAQNFDFYDIKGLATAFLHKLGISNLNLDVSNDSYWDSENALITVEGHTVGSFGRIGSEVCEHFKIKTADVFGFCFDFETLFTLRPQARLFEAIPRFPSVPFDLALLVDVDTPVAAVASAIWASAGPYLRSCTLFDFYQGEQVPAGRKSLAFSLTFSSKERTLSDEEVEESVKGILQHLAAGLNIELRPR
jgi:phenylalanyl-tRNA synthetase beta chain